jgi:electron transport complex protein RnfC
MKKTFFPSNRKIPQGDHKPVASIKGGAHVPHTKVTAEGGSVRMPAPPTVVLPLQQHIGAPCTPRVKVGDIVYVGQVIADTDAFVAAPIHATVSGKVKSISPYLLANGDSVEAIQIENDGLNTLYPNISVPTINNLNDFLEGVRQSGMVGIGGAGFPLHGKLTLRKEIKVDTLIVNGAECEPYITTDYREMMENSAHILDGIERIMQYIGIPSCLIGIEANKPKAITLLTNLIKERNMERRVSVVELPTLYPHGAEKMLIWTLTGRTVPLGGLPSDANAIVLNISSVSILNYYLDTGIPLVRKRITVDGGAILWPQNLFVPIGTSIKEIIEFCGNFIQEPEKIILGGPMMGLSLYNISGPLMKQNNAILCLTKEEMYAPENAPCIRCGRCVSICPMNLLPTFVERYSKQGNVAKLRKLSVNGCMECGSCAFACPAKRPLVQYLRHGKLLLRKAGN